MKHKMSGPCIWCLVALSSVVSSACTSTTCADIGGSVELTKSEVYRALRGDAGSNGGEVTPEAGAELDTEAGVLADTDADDGTGAPDAATGAETGTFADDTFATLPCPTSEEVSLYMAMRHQKDLAASAILPPTDHATSCLYPIVQVMCDR